MQALPRRWMRAWRARHYGYGTPHATSVQTAVLAIVVVAVAVVLVLLTIRRS